MSTRQIIEMTEAQLNALIEDIVNRQLSARFSHESGLIKIIEDRPDSRSLDAVFDSIAQNIWTPPPGAKSSVELLREDRDR